MVQVFDSVSKSNVKTFNVSNQQGVGMIEVLVTLFILSIGLLGVASLQFLSSLTNSDALNRSQSVMVAQEFSERLRANAVMSQVGDGMIVNNQYFDSDLYNFENLSCADGGTPYNCYCLEFPAGLANCISDECSASELAAFDAYETSCAAVASNPSAALSLACSDNDDTDTDLCSTGSRHSIIISWPVQNWQNIDRVLNSECNVDKTEPHDCVILDVTL